MTSHVLLYPGAFTPGAATGGGPLRWDGKDDLGKFVGDGSYLATFEWMTPSGRKESVTVPLTVLYRNRALVHGVSIAPNPVVAGGSGVAITVDLSPAANDVSVTVYTVSGEEVWQSAPGGPISGQSVSGGHESLQRVFRWNLAARGGKAVSSGAYVAVARAKSASGRTGSFRARFAISR